MAALLGYAREGDAIVVVGIDRLGRNAAEVMATIRELGERGIVLRSLREGIDTSNAAGRMLAGVPASLADGSVLVRRQLAERTFSDIPYDLQLIAEHLNWTYSLRN